MNYDLLSRCWAVIFSLDAKLSLLRHRCEHDIPWGSLGVYERHEIDEAIGQARRLEEDLRAVLGNKS